MNENYKNYSLIEIAKEKISQKKKAQTLESIINDVFDAKGIEKNPQVVAQFEVDFMLSGLFIYCGEDKNGSQKWDLKERVHTNMLDKDADIYVDPYANDEEVLSNELTYGDNSIDEDFVNDDDETKDEEDDEISEGLGLVIEGDETEEADSRAIINEEDEEEEEEDEDEIEIELNKKRKK